MLDGNQVWGWNFDQSGPEATFTFSACGGWEAGAQALLALHVDRGAELKVSRHHIFNPGRAPEIDSTSFEIVGPGGVILSAMADVAAFMESQDVGAQ
mgnify:CR=1 FL=1